VEAQSFVRPVSPVAQERITDAERQRAVAAVRTGRLFDLGTELAHDMPMGPADNFGGFRLTPFKTPECLVKRENPPPFDISVEVVQGCQHLGTHIDALAHVAVHGRHFGNVSVLDAYGDFGWKHNGIESVVPIFTRGLLLDIPRALGVDRLPDRYEVVTTDLELALEMSGETVRSGDAVLVRTGKMLDYVPNGSYFDAGPGVGVEAGIWLYDRGMAVLGTDTSASEPFPFRDEEHTLHRALLFERGVNLVEIMNLEELARSGVTSFLFVCSPLRLRGGTGSWVRPIAVA